MQFSFAQEKTVTGVVSDELGPVAGANVVNQATKAGTTTDFDGNYSIKAKQGDVLVISYAGSTQKVTVGAGSTYNVTLKATVLEETVVVAYGTQKKEALTGSVGTIKAEKIATITTADVTQGLVGKLAGVQVSNNNGMPGENASIRIRGIASLSSSNEPLYVIDGIPFYGNMNSLNNQDIESMTVLKDASAAALYGSRGAAGVIIITTKKGKSGKQVVTVDSRIGTQSRAVKDYDFIDDPKSYYEAYYQAYKNTLMFTGAGMDDASASSFASENLINGSLGLAFNNYNVPDNQLIDPATGKLNPSASLLYNENWSDYLFGDGLFSQQVISVSGANENTSHYFSLGYQDDEGYTVNSGFQKITARLRLESKIGDKFKFGGNVSYSNTEQDYLDGYTGNSTYSSPFNWVRSVAPIYPVRAYGFDGLPIYNSLGQHIYDDGTGAGGLSPIRPFGSLQNPYATALNDYKKRKNDNLFVNAFAEIDIFKGLTFTYTATGELYSRFNVSMDTQLYGDAVNAGGRISSNSSRQLALTQQQLLKYQNNFKKHNIEVLAGHETLNRRNDYVGAERSKMLFDSPFLDQAALNQNNFGGSEEYSLESYLGRVLYDYDNKYFVNVSARADGSSKFIKDNRWGTFYGLGLAWRVSQEGFMKNISWLDELKLKASIGQQGNDGLQDDDGNELLFGYLTPYSVVYTTDSSLPIQINTSSYLGNKNITWETTTNSSVGFNASLFNRRLNIEAEYFKKDITDMLFRRPLAPSAGFAWQPENIGDMNNKGFEVSIDGQIFKNKDWSVELFVNATHYKNTITKLVDNGRENNYQVFGSFIREEGGSAYDFYLYEFAGVNPANGAGLFWSNVDDNDPSAGRVLVEGTGGADLYRIGKSALPDVFGGFGTNINYKNFDLGINFAYQYGGYSSDSAWLGGMDLSERGGALHSDFFNTWTPNNVNASLPRVDIGDPNNYYTASTLRLIKSDYLSIQDITAGYNFDDKLVSKLGLSKLRLYGLVNNVHLWSKRQGFDPRQSGVTGASSNNYSLLRTMSFGINLEF